MTEISPASSMTLEPGDHTIAVRHGGRDRPYVLHVPSVPLRRPAVLVLELHGRGIDPVRFDRWTGFSALGDEVGFAVAMPAAIDEIRRVTLAAQP